MAYRFDLFDITGKRVAILQQEVLTSAEIDTSIDGAPTLTLSLPASDHKSDYISPLYKLKIWNTQTSEYEFSVFELVDPDIVDGSSDLQIEATYQGIATRLSREYVDDYDTTSSGKPFTDVIDDLLAYQVNTPAITVGTLEPTPSVAIAAESSDIYSVLNSIRSAYGGWFEVDSNYQLNWYEDNTETPQRRIERRKNLKAITYTPMYSKIVNRVYAYGKGEGTARINLTDAGEAQEYIEDTTSLSTYGVYAKKYIDKSITHPTTLLNYAQRILAEYKDPPHQYSIDVLNLAEANGFDYSFESLGLDTRVRVIDDLLGVDVNTSIVSMSINLLAPEEIQIELSTVKNDLSDLFGDILSIQDVQNSIATQIGAGQVTVLGTFNVIDWVTGGTTTIDGGNITANTITANEVNFTVVDSTNVVGTINASSEGIVISGTKIQINGTIGSGDALSTSGFVSGAASGWKIDGAGDAEFNNVTVRGNLAACTISSGQTLVCNGGIKVIGTSPVDTFMKIAESDTSTDYFVFSKGGLLLYYNNIAETTIYTDLDLNSAVSCNIPSTATGTNSAALSASSFNPDRPAAFLSMNIDADVEAVLIQSFSTTKNALKVNGGLLSDTITCTGAISCNSLSVTQDITCNDITTEFVYFDAGNTYLFESGGDLYWYDGTTSTKLN